MPQHVARRVNVVLSPRHWELLDNWCEEEGVLLGSLVADLLETLCTRAEEEIEIFEPGAWDDGTWSVATAEERRRGEASQG